MSKQALRGATERSSAFGDSCESSGDELIRKWEDEMLSRTARAAEEKQRAKGGFFGEKQQRALDAIWKPKEPEKTKGKPSEPPRKREEFEKNWDEESERAERSKKDDFEMNWDDEESLGGVTRCTPDFKAVAPPKERAPS